MNTPIVAQSNTFYEQIKNCQGLDLRDNRGKIHSLEFVLLGVIIALYRNRDGVLSSIHRSMVNMHDALCRDIVPVSRAQLPIILKKVNSKTFNDVVFMFLGVNLTDEENQWFAADGKELRGSIAKGDHRGEAVVQIVSHKDRSVHGQVFYNGLKESERPCVRQLLEGDLGNKKTTLDALHFIPETVKHIEKNGGSYLIGLKENQKELSADMRMVSDTMKPTSEYSEIEKSHGRIDTRTYMSFDLDNTYFDPRWEGANFQTLVKVERGSYNCKSTIESKDTAYYVSNAKVQDGKGDDLFGAVRGHWNVETNNHIRDVTFKEDALKTKHPVISRVLASCRTGIINLLYQVKPKNMKAKLEEFSDNFELLLKWLTEVKIL
jgi:predicted transposase YbfD/YdcC